MISITTTIIIVAGVTVFFVVAFLLALIVREFSENRRLRLEQARERGGQKKDEALHHDAPPGARADAYSYNSIVMDEVLGEKLIDELKRSLHMTEEMYQKLSERFKDDRDRRIELANDWLKYLEAIDNIKQARIDYRMNNGDGESLMREQDGSRIKLEIESKFKNLLQQSDTAPPAA